MRDPLLPDEVSARDLAPAARNELKTLSKDNAERVARHLAMAANEIDDNPAVAHEHAQAAVRHAGRVAVARETLAITAYAMSDFSLALRELRTLRRLTGKNEHIAMIVDSERGVDRPEKALEEGNAASRDELETAQRVQLAIAMSGARLDLGQTELALAELDIAELDPNVAFSWSPGLFAARAAVLEDLGLALEADEWQRRADIAAEAIAQELARDDELVLEEIPEVDFEDEEGSDEDGTLDEPIVGRDDDLGDDGEPVGDAVHPASETIESGAVTTAAQGADEADSVETESGAGSSDDDEDTHASSEDDAGEGAPVPAVEDEVSELLIEAGVDEPGDDAATGHSTEAAEPVGDAAEHDREEDRPDGALF